MNETLLAGILNSLDDGVAAFDLDGHTLCCNDAACRLLHMDAKTLRNVFDLPTPVRAFFGGVRSGDTKTVDLYHQAVRLTYHDIREDGLRVGAVLTLSDIGEQDRVERIRREFTANVSHELKTPLTSISGYAEMIENGMAKGADIGVFAERIRRESNRMLALVSDIIALSELEERGIKEQEETVDLYAIAQENIETLKSAAMVRGVTVQLNGTPFLLRANPVLMGELVYNLVDNAIRYNRDNGSVTVRVSDGRLTVRDTGIGIPRIHRDRIFERFYRVDKSRSKATGGTGLGLAIVKHICELYNAGITLDSAEGIGTEITVRFPNP